MENNNSMLKGETVVDVQKLMNLENSVNLRDQTIGSHRAQINNLQEQVNTLKQEHQIALDKAQKEVIISTSDTNGKYITCDCCGYNYTSNSRRGACPNCGARNTNATGTTVSYKNLEDTAELIRKEEAKKLKVDLNAFENKLQDLELEKENVEKEKARLRKRLDTAGEEQETAVAEAKKDVRERYKKELEILEKRNTILEEEIEKIREDKTDVLIEANRKTEIVELKNRVTELETEIKELETLSTKPFNFKGLLQKRRNEKLALKAITEKEEKADRIKSISKAYPEDKDKSFWNVFQYPWGKIENPYDSKSGKLAKAWNKFKVWF